MPFRRILILGGARSGKSTFAERMAGECGEPVLYVATASETDDEMAKRIAQHRARRVASWRTLEVPTAIAARVAAERDVATMVIEDLTLLLSNYMEDDAVTAEDKVVDEVLRLVSLNANLVMVTNEVGMGIVPPYPLGRVFRDALGRVNQAAAGACDEVYLIVAGLPLRMK